MGMMWSALDGDIIYLVCRHAPPNNRLSLR